MEKNVLIKIEYDGSAFHGWQRQPGLRTVQGELEMVLSQLCGQSIEVAGTGRTDRGVHAMAQCATFKGDFGIPVENIPKAANAMLSDRKNTAGTAIGDVRILSAKQVDSDFHARFSCKGKTYSYRICTGEPHVFRRNYVYYVKDRLDLDRMKRAAAYIVGTHDFKCFEAAGGNPRETTVRTIYDVKIYMEEGDLVIDVTGDGFLYNMVRIIAGTLVDIGRGKMDPDFVKMIIQQGKRSLAGHTAPPYGLYMKEIYFSDDFKEVRRDEQEMGNKF